MEAKIKYAEAQKCGAEFGPADESPDKCMMDLASTVSNQIASALKDAGPMAEVKLNQARSLAIGFALDTRQIDAQLASLKGPMPAPAAVVNANDPRVVGQDMLDKARLEIKRGQCDAARQLATEVHNGPYGLQAEAVVILRTIDVEEHNQRVLAANRNFDAGLAAYRSKNCGQAVAILQQVDPALLAPEKKAQIRDIMADCSRTAMAQATTVPPPPPGSGVMPASTPGTAAGGVKTAAASGVTGLQGQMPKMAAPAEGDSLAAQVHAMQEIEYQALRDDGLKAQSQAIQQWERGETDGALETLDAYMKKVKASKLDATSVARLQKPIEIKLSSFKLLKAQKDDVTRITSAKDHFLGERSKEFTAEQKKQQQVKDLMKEYNALYKEGKYAEAEIKAAKAHELDPDDPTLSAAVQVAEYHDNLTASDNLHHKREKYFVENMNDTDDVGPNVSQKNPVAFDKVRLEIAKNRDKDRNGINVLRSQSPKDQAIQAKLNKPVQVNFHNVPLRQAVEDLQQMTGMNIHLMTESLSTEAINPETPVSLKADNVSLKAALRVLLDQAHLTYMIQDEMLKITTHRAAQGNLVRKVYSVADLVIPIDDFITPDSQNYEASMQRIINSQKINLNGGGNTPQTNRLNMLPNGTPVGGTNSMSTVPGGDATMRSNGVGPGSTGSTMSYIGSVAPTKQNMEDLLIKLITNTIAPAELGRGRRLRHDRLLPARHGPGHQPDAGRPGAGRRPARRPAAPAGPGSRGRGPHDHHGRSVLRAYRLDFNMNIDPTSATAQSEPQTRHAAVPAAGSDQRLQPAEFNGGLTVIGLSTGPGNFTSDLDIPIRHPSFKMRSRRSAATRTSPGSTAACRWAWRSSATSRCTCSWKPPRATAAPTSCRRRS